MLRMSRRLFLGVVAVVAGLTMAGPLAAQTVRTVDPALTIRVARDERGASNASNPGAVVSCVALSADGRTLAAVGDDHLVRTFAAADGRPLDSLPGHDRWIRGAAFTPDGQLLITADEASKLVYWNAATRQIVREINAGVQVYGLACAPLGDQLAVVGFGDRVRLFNAAGQPAGEFLAPGRDTRAVGYSADGQLLAAAAHNGKLCVWRGPQPTPIVEIAKAHRRAIFAVAFSPDGQYLASGGDGEFIHVWNVQTGQKRLSIRRAGKTRSLVFCGADLLAAGGTDNRVRIWDLARVEKLPPPADVHVEDMQLVGHQGSVTSLVYDARAGQIISGSYDTTVRVWTIKPAAARTTDGGTESLR
jgi:WD40 repeat protein